MAVAATPMKSAAKGISADAKPFDWEDPFLLDDQLTEEETRCATPRATTARTS